MTAILVTAAVVALLVVLVVGKSVHRIGPAEVGLVNKKVGLRKLRGDNPIAFRGEAGYQAELLMPGLRFRFWPISSVTRCPWVQVPAGEIGVVIAQVGEPLPIGAKSAVYKSQFGNFTDLKTFIENGGQKGVQRPVLSPGTLAPIHPVAFLVITKPEVFGVPVSSELHELAGKRGQLTFSAPLDAGSAQATSNYHVTQAINKKKTAVVPVLTAVYSASNHSVTLTLGTLKPGKPLQVMVSGLRGAGGALVGSLITNL